MRCAHSLCALLLAAGCTTLDEVAAPAPHAITPIAYDLLSPSGARALLLGAIHVARSQDWELPPDLAAALERADVLVFEVDLASIDGADGLRMASQLGTLPPGLQLRDLISAETWALLEQRAPELGVPLEPLQRFEPWLVALEFMTRSLDEAGYGSEHGVEWAIRRRASSKPLRGLETPRDQYRVFDALPPTLQDRMLRDALDPQATRTLTQLVDAWRRGDGQTLETILFEDRDDPQMAPLYAALYTLRNQRMATALAGILLHARNAFVVVGVGHLLGEGSLPELLVRRGFRVRRRGASP